MTKQFIDDLLHKELSYIVHGAAIEVRKDFGPGHKESIYQQAFSAELRRRNLNFEKEKSIKIYSPKDGAYIGLYRPDFIIDDKILVEIKAERFVHKDEIKRMYDYLRNSKYELIYFINFASPRLYVRRIIYSNNRKPFLKFLLASIGFVLAFISGIYVVEAANVSFSGQTEIGINNQVRVDLILDTQGENINAVEGAVIYPRGVLGIKEISDGNSIVNFWIQKPKIALDNKIVFSGIIAGGYNGKGKVFSVVFQTLKEGNVSLAAEDVKIFLNDGQGTSKIVSIENFELAVLSDFIGGDSRNTAEPDAELPESFQIYLSNDENVFNGKWFIVFATQDKKSGIDHYEVSERKQGFLNFLTPSDWVIAESPYLLKDQELKSDIYVRAYDKKGNSRIVYLSVPNHLKWYENWLVWVIILIVAVAVYARFKKYYGKKNR